MSVLPALSPKIGGMCISELALEKGDVIVSTTNGFISEAIRAVTDSAVSHAIIYVGNGMVVEAIREGVTKRSVNAALNEAILAVAYRHIQTTADKAEKVVSFAESQVGKKYDSTGIAGQAGYLLDKWYLCTLQSVKNCEQRAARNNLWMESNKRFFCSELVAEAYRQAGIPITAGESASVSPQGVVEVVSSGQLSYVGHLRA